MYKRSLLQSALALALAAGFVTGASAQDKPVKIGVTGGPHAQIFEVVKKVAEKDGLKIQVIEFSDYVQPNAALAAGDLDANSYQHKPYLDQQVKDRGYKFVSAGYTVNFPIGIYSKKVKSLDELKSGAKFGIPNDPTNGGRVLGVTATGPRLTNALSHAYEAAEKISFEKLHKRSDIGLRALKALAEKE